ncbi:MAG: glycosyltransferase family 39 protein [Phycisphaerae bacterium]
MAVAVHACALGAVHLRVGGVDGYAFSSLDGKEYYAIARNLVDQGVFSQDSAAPYKPDTWRTPGYPVFLALAMLSVGKSPGALVAAQQLLAVINVLLFFLTTSKLLGNRWGTVASLLFLFEPYHLYYSTWLLSTTLFVTALLASWYSWQRAVERWQAAWLMCLGASCSMLVLIRPVGALVPVVAALGVVWLTLRARGHTPNGSVQRRGKTGLVLFMITLLTPWGAWAVRNKITAGHFALSHQSGVVLAYFKATEVLLWKQGRSADRYLETSLDPARADYPHTVWEDIDERLRARMSHLPNGQPARLGWRNLAQGNKTTLDSFAVSEALGRIGWGYLADMPFITAACCLARCGSILTFPLTLALRPPAGLEARRAAWLAMSLPYVLLSLAALVTLIRSWPTYGIMYFPLGCTVALLLASTPQLDPRFRVPLIPMLIFIALRPR